LRERPIFWTPAISSMTTPSEILRNGWSFIFLVDVSDKRIERARMVPARLNFAHVDLAEWDERDTIARRMIDACSALGTHVESAGRMLEAVIAPPVTATS
jgi:hypothetical protein